MSLPTRIEHLYALFSAERVMILGSKLSLESLAVALDQLEASQTHKIELAIVQTPHDETTFGALHLTHSATPLICLVDAEAAYIAGDRYGLDRLATSLRHRSDDWFDGGHSHIYPGEEFDDRLLVSPESNELLIGGLGYLPSDLFGLPPGD